MPTDTPATSLSGDSSASLTATTLSTDLSQTQLIANGVSFDYSGAPVLRNIDLTLSAGDVLGLVGDNGAGKSTLMWVLSGRRKPTSGVVTHVGQRVLGFQELEAPFDSTGEMLIKEALGRHSVACTHSRRPRKHLPTRRRTRKLPGQMSTIPRCSPMSRPTMIGMPNITRTSFSTASASPMMTPRLSMANRCSHAGQPIYLVASGRVLG